MEEGWKFLINLLAKTADPNTVDQLLDALLTPAERVDLDKRIRILDALLAEKLPQRAIAQELGVSISKITRGANALKRTDPKIKALLSKNWPRREP